MAAPAKDTKETMQMDLNKQILEQKLQNAHFLPTTRTKMETVTKNMDDDTEVNEEEKKSEEKPSKPGQARKIRVYLVDPDRFVIEWCTPKKMGKPLPLHYDIIINNNPFKKVVTQYVAFPDSTNKNTKKQNNDKRPHTLRILVFNCDYDEIYKVGIDTYNDKIKGKQSTLYQIKTIIKPSVVTDLKMNDGIITWKPPIYESFGNLKYELIDANDIEEKTILSTENNCYEININQYYKDKDINNLDELQWRIRIKETKHANYSFSPVIPYNFGDIQCAKFTAAKIFEGDINIFTTQPIKYPKWEPPIPPDILKDIKTLELEDKGSYMVVPSKLDPLNNNVLTIICFSDTHTKHKVFRFDKLPPADIVLHAGDFTFDGNKSEVLGFEKWGKFISSLNIDESKNKEIYSDYYDDDDDDDDENKECISMELEERKYKHLICIAGNHEMTFDIAWYNEQGSNAKRYHRHSYPVPNALEIREIISSSSYWKYLQDSMVSLYGLTIYGSPWQPYFYNWAFQLSRGKELDEKWKLIPINTHILLTHGPPYCHGDKVAIDRVKITGDHLQYTGDKMLINRVKEIGSIQYHIFGHVHAGTGCSIQNGINTTFINASSLNEAYAPTRKPIVFYIEKKL